MIPNDSASLDHASVDNACGPVVTGLAAIALFFGGFGGWAALAPLDGAVIAPAVVQVDGNRKAVQHRDGGIVRNLLVHEGDRVSAGQVLLRLDDADLRAQADSLAAQLTAAQARRARLLAEQRGSASLIVPAGVALPAEVLAGEQTLLDSRRRALDSAVGVLAGQVRQAEAQIVGHQAQIASLERQIALIADELAGTRMLEAKGWAPKTKLRQLERTAAQLDGQRAERQADIAAARQGIARAELQMVQLCRDQDADVAQDLRDVENTISNGAPRLDGLLSQLRRSELHAPQAGVVVGLTAFTEGGVIGAGQTVMEIVPDHHPLVIAARLRPEDIDDVRPGLAAEVRLTGLNQRDSLPIAATIRHLSADRLADDDNAQAYYEMLVEIAPDAVPHTAFQPGMPAEVTIPLKARTALDYLTEPLLRQMSHALREL